MGFDLEKYLNHSRKVDLSEFDFSNARQYRLTTDEVRCLKYMMDVESQTIVYLRSILRTSLIDDPETIAFLSCWTYEEYFHGRTIREFLNASGVEVPADRYVQVKRTASLRTWLEEIGISVLSYLTHRLRAVYLTWGAVQELTTLEGYGVLATRTANPLLKTILARIIKDERRHFSFYDNKARIMLEGDRRAQQLTTLFLKKFWEPVGSGIKHDPEVNWMIQFVFGNPIGAAAACRVDSTIARLPGLAWFDLLGQEIAHCLQRSAA